ncbi:MULTISPECIES: hypothetical protein [Stenotrophomonas]|jgi:hypothetical protein|uniref:hypothetical protein n=1 Tax=Stenotrophomonas TaxID=40323 RepID=UPI0002F046D0|nr:MULTISPECIES: hypothetical protein [Stenotrophomonas]MBD3827979.1 hypothetical protein [Stenotrophomonas sp.]QIO88423.1 hypothetical protein G9274_002108 [Stenotrophomonas rhizophila]
MPSLARRAALPLLALCSAAALSACVSSPGPAITGPGLCDASGLGWSVGHVADEATLRRLLRESGAGLINPIGPATITSKDLRKDRLRVFIDKDNIITAARCE